jgi:catechol 2,3-dioxygenase-like lactoylglutathione lyase family enzyme
MKSEPMIAVENVEKSSAWYAELLQLSSGHGGPYHDWLVDEYGQTQLHLHCWESDFYPTMDDASGGKVGHGLVLCFRVSEIDQPHARAQKLRAAIERTPFINDLTNQKECWLRDPDGYLIILCGPRQE